MLTGARDNPRVRSFGCQWGEPLWDVASVVHSQTHPTLQGLHHPHPQAMELVPFLQLLDLPTPCSLHCQFRAG